MITGRQVLTALQTIEKQNPKALDEPLYATYGNDENGNADVIPVEALLEAGDPAINGIADPMPFPSEDGQPRPVVVLLNDEGKTSPLELLEETIGLLEQSAPTLMPDEYERLQAIKQLTADIREGMNAL